MQIFFHDRLSTVIMDPGTPSLRIHPITSLEQHEIGVYRTLRRPHDHRARGIFVAEGARVVDRLLRSPVRVLSLMLTPEWLLRLERAIQISHPGIDIFVAGHTLMQQIVGFHLHQGIMAVGEVPPDLPLSAIPQPHLLVALDALHHAENVGTLVRNCAAFGADALITGETTSSPYMRRSVRNSMGAIFSLPIHHSANLRETLRALRRDFGTTIVAADAGGGGRIEGQDFRGNICIVAGNEGAGISPEIFTACDARIGIPMDNSIDSLNVATAIAVMLYEARQQRSLLHRR
jgi:tRNA G18 (ribose-2'-O)-methylase SpoU